MTEEVAGGPVQELGTSPVPGDQSPALDDTQQRARASGVEEPEPSAPSVWPRHAWATANPRSDPEFRSPGADLGCWQYQAAVPSCLVDRVNPALPHAAETSVIRINRLKPVHAERPSDTGSARTIGHTGCTRCVAPDVERRRRPARPPSLLAAVPSTRTTPSPDLCGPRRAPERRGWCCRGL